MLKEHLPESSVFDFDDVMLVPQKCVVKSRSEVDVTAQLGNRKFALPVVPANMSTIVDESTCEWLAQNNIFYVMHRFDVDAIQFTRTMHEKGHYASISLGIKQHDYDTVERFASEGVTPDYVTVDVAHGDSDEVLKVVSFLRKNLPEVYIIAGNVATAEAALRLALAGANAVKVGIGPGLACLTAPNTGFGSQGWQLAAVAQVAESLKATNTQIIADGGIRHYGDIAKAVAFGADFVMIGGMFAAHAESPGELLEIDGELKKEFFGSASEHQKGEVKHVEGRKMFLPYKGSLEGTIRTIKENLQSSVSYAGGKELKDLTKVEYVLRRR